MGSSASLRQVRVVGEDVLDPDGTVGGGETPILDKYPCPVCGTETPVANFRVEASGEVWTGQAAVWAEEGVCPACYKEVLGPHIREWTKAEWLVHHYEGWKTTVEAVHDIFVYEESAHEAWLPESERHRVLDVEKTLAARREHLGRCQMAMKELQGRYEAKITPPPFQMTLASGSRGLEERVVARLKGMRERDLQKEMARRNDSVMAVSPALAEGGGPPRRSQRRAKGQGRKKQGMSRRNKLLLVLFVLLGFLGGFLAVYLLGA